MLTRKEFDVLTKIESAEIKLSQRELSRLTGYSIGTINSTLAFLEENKLTKDSMITEKGITSLEPYRVQRVIFIAAGFGSRMIPITLNTPKPLIRVKGERIIDSMLDAVLKAEIQEIIIVRGYLAEQFDQLLYKYPNIKFIDNPSFNEGNNISSALCAKEYLSNSYICEADLILKNPSLITKYQYSSNYCGIKCDFTDDWCLFKKKGRISGVSVGGENGWRMLGISYWNSEDGNLLRECLEKAYKMPGGKERYWDSVPLSVFNDKFNLEIRECSFDDFIELDTFNELKEIDKSYEY
ncbi:MAG: phosphocholine cytidylyltransferase family protein [Treponema sp.]|nr:phosphocholine cytidylyltransferase family protein [Treponema sp.]